jgi:hypothetical protein
MTEKQKSRELLGKLHEKYYGSGSKAQKERAKVEKVIKEKGVDKVNRKLADAGIPIQFSSGKKLDMAAVDKPLGNTGEKAGTRAGLMAQAKVAGIKYFRIMTKDELKEVVELHGQKPAYLQERVKQIQDGAKARWKRGWGSKSKEENHEEDKSRNTRNQHPSHPDNR